MYINKAASRSDRPLYLYGYAYLVFVEVDDAFYQFLFADDDAGGAGHSCFEGN